MRCSRPSLVVVSTLALAASLSAGLAAQAPTQLTTSGRQHEDALISPNGLTVAFRANSTDLGLVDIPSSSEAIVYSSPASTVGNFVWSPVSTGIYFTDGGTVRFISNSGSAGRSLGTVAGSNVDVWAVDSSETIVFGTRFEQATATTYVFTVATNGASQPVDIYSVNGTLAKLKLDRTDQFLLMEQGQGAPFTPLDYVRLDVSGANPVVLHTTSGTDNAGSPMWLDAGATMGFTAVDPTNNRPQIFAADASGTIAYTQQNLIARRPVTNASGSWIAFEAQTPLGRRSIGLMDTRGGGVFYITADHGLLGINGANQEGGLSLSANGNRLVFNAEATPGDPNMQIYSYDLSQAIRVAPRLEVGQPFSIEMPLAQGEIGVVGAADGFTTTVPVTLPGFSGQFDLDPATTATVLVGIGPNPGLGNYTIPNNPALVGAFLYFQGVRLTGPNSGAFTSFGYYQVF